MSERRMNMDRDALIAALEAATGPSRELDAEIVRICGAISRDGPFDAVSWNYPGEQVWHAGYGHPPFYTDSIDAGLMLVPDEWTAWEVRTRRGKTWFEAQVSRVSALTGMEESVEGAGSTPAVALCIAALKADTR